MADEERTTRPSFTSVLWAAWRQGQKELAQILPAFPESVRPIEEPGSMGNPTPQMVTEEMGTLDGYNRMLESYAKRGQQHGNLIMELRGEPCGRC